MHELRNETILFVTREPVIHQTGGSSVYALGLVRMLARSGVRVVVVCTNAKGRSPRVWIRNMTGLPAGVEFRAPGFARFGENYYNVHSPRAWARIAYRAAQRLAWLRPLAWLTELVFGDAVYANAWDLTPPTRAELELGKAAVAHFTPRSVIVNYACMAPLLAGGAAAGARRVVLMHDLLAARVERFRTAGMELDCPAIDEATEMRWLGQADLLLAAQAEEAAKVATSTEAEVVVLPVCFEPKPLGEAAQARRCLFVGSKIAPNLQGLQWFLQAVWPRVLEQVPDAVFAVAGRVSAAVPAGARGVEALGLVEDLEAEYAQAAVVVVPLQVGTGIKIKLVEALSYGRPVVSTTVGVEGIAERVRGAVVVTDEAEAFADAVVRLMRDDAERARLGDVAMATVRGEFSEAAVGPGVLRAVLGE